MEYKDQLVKLMEKVIEEVHDLFTMDRVEAARKYGKEAKDIDRFLLDRADSILSGAKFFIDFNKPQETENKE